MAIITISRGSYSKGREIAEKTAEKLGYECISRDILLEASEEFHIPEIKLVRSIHDAPSILRRLGKEREKYISFIQSAMLRHLKNDNIVYHGLAGHFFVKDIPHVLKVRILADMDDRVRLEMEREGISEKEALKVLKKDDEERRKWSQSLYGIDTNDSSLYDLVIHIRQLEIDDAVDLICQSIRSGKFETDADSLAAINDLALTAELRTLLSDSIKADINSLKVHDGEVKIKIEASLRQESLIHEKIHETLDTYPGVKDVKINIIPMAPFGM